MQFLSDRDVKLFCGTEQLLSCHSAVIARVLGCVLSCVSVRLHGRGTCGFRSPSCLAAGCNFLSNRVVKLLGVCVSGRCCAIKLLGGRFYCH